MGSVGARVITVLLVRLILIPEHKGSHIPDMGR